MSMTRRATQAERHNDARQQLSAAVEALRESEGFRGWLKCRASFRNYSFNNVLLIVRQRPDATQVAGFRQWQKLGRTVTRGEHAVWIYAPLTVIERDAEGRKRLDEDGEPVRRTVFRLVPVFDVSQTEGEALPSVMVEPLSGQSHMRYWQPLVRDAESLGYTVKLSELSQGEGVCHPTSRLIEVDERLPANARVKTLIHEVAHAHGIDYKQYRPRQAEIIVEAVAYIVGAGIGLAGEADSVPYVAMWQGEGEEEIERFATTIDTIAGKIEAALEPGYIAEAIGPELERVRAAA